MTPLPSRDQLRNIADFLLPALLLAVTLTAAAVFAFVRLENSIDEVEHATRQRLAQIAEAVELSAMLNRTHIELHSIVAARQAPAQEATTQALDVGELDARLTRLEHRFDAIGAWGGDAATHARVKANLQTYRALVLTVLDADARAPHEAARDLTRAQPLYDTFVSHANALVAEVAASAARSNADELRLIRAQLGENLSGNLAAIALALALAGLLGMQLARHRDTLAQALRQLAQDELEPEHFETLTQLSARTSHHLAGLAQTLLQLRDARIAQRDDAILLKTIIEQAPCAIELVDPVSLRFLQTNAYSRQALGYSEAELRQLTVMDIQAGLDPAQLKALVQDTLARRSMHFEAVHRASDGRLFNASVRTGVIRLRGRDYLLGIWQDISAERETMQALKTFSMAIEQSPNAVIITDTQARIEYVNDAFVHTSGYTREELIGRNPRLLKSGKTPDAVYAALWANLLKGEGWRGELINRRKDGEEYIELAHISPIRQPDGRITHYLAIKQDITEKRRLIEELQRHRNHLEQRVAERSAELRLARDAAEVANRAKSEFLANMSHEIRTPLNAIIGLSALLAKDLHGDKERTCLAKITGAARQLLQIINDILDLSKIEAGRLEMEATDFEPQVMLHGALELVRQQAEQKGLALSVDCAGLPQWVRGDALRLSQIILNFVSNAVKFTPQGQIGIRARVQSEAGEQLHVRFEVTDTGIGLDESERARIFQPFEQADPSITRRYGGTGLGLAISRRLTELMGGTIGVHSIPGKGSTFWIEVPLQSSPASAHPPAIDPGHTAARGEIGRLQGRRILLAEDNPINREVAVAILREAGATIDTAENGQQALDMVSATRYDLVLMDVQMPVMDGLSAARLLRSREAFRDLPILAMTANAFAEDRKRCIEAGMNDHIPKPVEPEVLYEKIARWLPPLAPSLDLAAAPAAAPAQPPQGTEALKPGAPAEDRTALASLRTLHELDVEAGLHYALGEPQVYLELLRLFAEGGYGVQLQAAIEAGDANTLRRTAHTIKGSAATIGASALSEAAAELEALIARASPGAAEALAQGPLHDAASALAARTLQFCDALGTATRTAATDASGDVARPDAGFVDTDPTQTAKILTRVEHLLTLGDIAVRELLETHHELLRATLGDRFTRFAEHIGDFDFDAALADLHAENESRRQARRG